MYETIIIGAGISGMTAAIYAARKKMDFLIISSDVGGQFLVSGEVSNYPGIKQTTGIEFLKKMEEQLKFNKIKVRVESAKRIEKAGSNFKVVTNKNSYKTKTVIIATGSGTKELNVPGEKEFTHKGVTYCSICDGPLFAGRDVAIIGSGDSAFDAADFMKNIAKKIYLVTKGKITAYEYLRERIENNKRVTIIRNADTREIRGGSTVTGILYEQNGKIKELKVNGVIIEIGRIPNTDFVKNFVKLDEHRHIIVDCWGQTSVKGIYSAGDCTSVHEYQYVTAAGEGCTALLKAARYLARKK